MKKFLSKLLLMTCLLVLVSCSSKKEEPDKEPEEIDNQSEVIDDQTEVIDNQANVDELKALLNKQDLSPFYERTFASMYKQDYVTYINSYEDDEERSIDFYRYLGTGGYGFFYSVSEDVYNEIIEKDNVNPFDFITRGSGNYSLIQSAKVNAFTSEMVDGMEKRTTRDINFSQRLDSQFDDNDYQLYNSLELTDNTGVIPNQSKEFNGKVNKEELLEVVSTSWLTNTIQKVCAYDGQKNTELIDDLYYEVCKSLVNKTDKEISDFIKNNNIVISDGEEYKELAFELNDENIKQILVDNDIFPGTFKGTLYYDKVSGSYEKYSYEINLVNNGFNEEGGYVTSSTLSFFAEGYSYHSAHGSIPYIKPNPVVYTDAYDFVNDVVDNIIPPVDLS